MSKIGSYNLILQEQANELGFETVQEALDNDYEVVDGQLTYSAEKGMESAHKAFEREKRIVLGDLMNLMIHKVYDHDIIERAYKFVEEAHE